MKKRNQIVLGALLIFAVLTSAFIYINNNKKTEEITPYLNKKIVKSTRQEYEKKAQIYNTQVDHKMLIDGENFSMAKDEKTHSYFKLIIESSGCKGFEPINVEAYFVIDEMDNLLDKNSFVMHAPDDDSKISRAAYNDPIFMMEKYPPIKQDVKKEIIIITDVYLYEQNAQQVGNAKAKQYEKLKAEGKDVFTESTVVNYEALEVVR